MLNETNLPNSTQDEFRNNLISRTQCDPSLFQNNKNQDMLNLIFRYSQNISLVESKHVYGFFQLYKDVLKKIYKNDDIKNVLSLFNFGDEFNTKILTTLTSYSITLAREQRKLQQEANRKTNQEKNELEILNSKIKYTKLFSQLFQNNELSYSKLMKFINEHKYQITVGLGFVPTLKNVLSYFNVPDDLKQQLILSEISTKEELAKVRLWNSELLKSYELIEKLNIKKVEFERWREDERIPISATQDFSKWGKILTTTLHHPNDIKHITPKIIEKWREKDKQASTAKRKEGAKLAQAKIKIKKEINTTIKNLNEQNIFPANNLNQSFLQVITVPYSMNDFTYFAEVIIIYEISLPTLINSKNLINFEKEIVKFFKSIKVKNITSQINEEINNIIINIPSDSTLEEKTLIFENFANYLGGQQNIKNINNNTFNNLLRKSLNLINNLRETETVRKELNLEQYEQSFPAARSMNREFNLIFGPTNSGKTYQALETLKKAKSGVYLAPLRLLAMEIYDKLNASGVPCNLFTGEEQIIIDGAQHTASTVEMLNSENIVEVAIIDEVQMLSDDQRGWAWTAAVVGVPAQKVFCIGSDDIEPTLTLLIEYLNEKFSITKLERQCPLIVEKQTVQAYGNIGKGDVLIAFSRKEVLYHANNLKSLGYNVSTIYGALSPEVRRKQSDLFLNGINNVMVSTDAIGMGLNLPARRIIFSKVEKFDGVEVRDLEPKEIKQIAGRAGRYGLHDQGYVSALKTTDLHYVRNCLNAENPSIDMKATISPSFWHIEKLSTSLNTSNLSTMLTYFAHTLKINHNFFETANIETMIELSSFIEMRAKDFSLKDKFIFSCIPLNPDNESEINYLDSLIHAKQKNKETKLFSLPKYFYQNSEDHLATAEDFTKKLTIYSWLSYKYPEIYTDYENVIKYRSVLSEYITKALNKKKTSLNYESNFDINFFNKKRSNNFQW